MSDFRKALIWTAIPLVVLGVIVAAGTALPMLRGFAVGFGIIGSLGAVLVFAGLVAAVVFAIKGKRRIMAGILAGVGIGIVALGASCFASVFSRGAF